MVHPFIKLILELTNCEVDLEDPVGEVSAPISNVSDRSVIDCAVYYLKGPTAVRVLVLEAKTDKALSEHSVCQLVGYYMGTALCSNIPPLCLVMTQSKVRFVFFPYVTTSNDVRDFCADCFVSDVLQLLDGTSFGNIVGFIVKYVLAMYDDVNPHFIEESTMPLHSKKVYPVASERVIITTELEELQKTLEKERQERQDREKKIEQERQEREQQQVARLMRFGFTEERANEVIRYEEPLEPLLKKPKIQ